MKPLAGPGMTSRKRRPGPATHPGSSTSEPLPRSGLATGTPTSTRSTHGDGSSTTSPKMFMALAGRSRVNEGRCRTGTSGTISHWSTYLRLRTRNDLTSAEECIGGGRVNSGVVAVHRTASKLLHRATSRLGRQDPQAAGSRTDHRASRPSHARPWHEPWQTGAVNPGVIGYY